MVCWVINVLSLFKYVFEISSTTDKICWSVMLESYHLIITIMLISWSLSVPSPYEINSLLRVNYRGSLCPSYISSSHLIFVITNQHYRISIALTTGQSKIKRMWWALCSATIPFKFLKLLVIMSSSLLCGGDLPFVLQLQVIRSGLSYRLHSLKRISSLFSSLSRLSAAAACRTELYQF